MLTFIKKYFAHFKEGIYIHTYNVNSIKIILNIN